MLRTNTRIGILRAPKFAGTETLLLLCYLETTKKQENRGLEYTRFHLNSHQLYKQCHKKISPCPVKIGRYFTNKIQCLIEQISSLSGSAARIG